MQQLLEDPKLSHGGTGNPATAHWANKDDIGDAVVFGEELTALCGRKMIPQRDPANLPVCQRCQEIYDALPES